MELNLPVEARLLARRMRELSEEYTACVWHPDTEIILWEVAHNRTTPRAWPLTEEEKEELRFLHKLAGGWIVDTDGLNFMPTERWVASQVPDASHL